MPFRIAFTWHDFAWGNHAECLSRDLTSLIARCSSPTVTSSFQHHAPWLPFVFSSRNPSLYLALQARSGAHDMLRMDWGGAIDSDVGSPPPTTKVLVGVSNIHRSSSSRRTESYWKPSIALGARVEGPIKVEILWGMPSKGIGTTR